MNMSELNQYDAAAYLKMSPKLLEWLTVNAPKHKDNRKLDYLYEEDGVMFYDKSELTDFDLFLSQEWPIPKKSSRPGIPKGIKSEIKRESGHKCAICGANLGEFAHIDAVCNSRNNHPHNLIYLCPNCHTDYDKNNKFSLSEMKEIKNDILKTQVIKWLSHSKLHSSLIALANLLKEITETSRKSDAAIYTSLNEQIIDQIKKSVKKSASDDSIIEVRHRNSKKFDEYRKSIRKTIKKNVNSETEILKITSSYIEKSSETLCPLCNGNGVHNNLECPVCRGVGTVDKDIASDIDLSDFKQVDCPLCNGSGVHNNWECPVCRGVGTIDIVYADEIDLSDFKQLKCPLCHGSGVHNRRDCKICNGAGTVNIIDYSEIDLEGYDQVECPLCEGSGVHNRNDCLICIGVGTIDNADLDHLDLSGFKQADCPLCNGTGTHNRRECRVCVGVGTVNRDIVDEIELDYFDQVDCPQCNGSGSYDCNLCLGVGTIDIGIFEDLDI